jgi:PAS domain S-box-containing protein
MARRDIYADTLAVFDRREDRYEPLTTPEVADALDAGRRTVYQRLRTLADRGDLRTKTTGANSRIWWRPPDDAASSDPDATADSEDARRDPDLEQRSRVVESATDAIAITDDDGEYSYVNETHADVYGYDDTEAFLGEHWKMCYGEAERERFHDEIIPSLSESGSWRGEAIGRRKDGTTFPQDLSLTVADDGGIVCVVRDISDRKARERRLREAREFNEELVENAPFGMFRLDEELRITYENPRAEEIIGLPEGKESSDAIGVDIRDLPPIVETGQSDLFEDLEDGETIEFEFPFESIYGKEAYFTGRAVPVYRDGAFDGAILMATDISERRQYERELERQREQLAALDELNDVVRGITEAVIEQSTRDEIERVVCERLADSDSYRFAWTAAADSGSRLDPRVAAGVDGYIDDLSVSDRVDDPTDRGPIGAAVRNREMRISRNLLEGDTPEQLRADAREFGYRSLAAIPVVHQGMSYGVLCVCSERPDAFAAKERTVVGQLGDVIGHAIAAIDRKRALMSDEVVELDVGIPNFLDPEGESVPTDGTISIARVTPVSDDEYLMYGTASDGAMETIHALRDRRPEWGDVHTFDDRDGEVRFEQRLSDPPIASIVADYGGSVDTGTIEDGAYSATIRFPPGTNVRRVVDRLQETYLDVRIDGQRQVVRETPLSSRVPSTLVDGLTDRQRAALEAGYFGGYFDWPRHRSGEEVAASLGIGASTFHQHVRKAQRKLLDATFGD